MIEYEHTFQNADHMTIFYREWLPQAGETRGIVYISPGLGEHCGRYRHVAEVLTEAGFACYGIDHRGHGKSEGLRAFILDGWLSVDDLDRLYRLVRDRHPSLPALLFGHSMGSLIGLGFALRFPERLRGLALSGVPLHGEYARPSWLVSLCLWAANYLPKLRLSPPGSPTVLTGDEAALREWWADPLIDKGMWRIGTSAALMRMARQICAAAGDIKLPLLVMHGSDDRLAPASGSRFLAEHAGSSDVTLKLYDGLRHELVNEVSRAKIIDTMRDWMLAQI